MANILLVEDDTTFAQMLTFFVEKQGHKVQSTQRVKDAFKIQQQHSFQLILLDYRLPDGTGLDLLTQIREAGSAIPVIIMTSFNDVRTAIRAIRSGASEYITKPVNPDELLMVMNEALAEKAPADKTPGKPIPQFIRGNSAYADKLHEHIDLVAPTDMAVLIQGESGTGKEYVARMIHQNSKRADKPFIAIDCGALSRDLAASEFFGHIKGAFTGAATDKKGLFEAADGGTLFMDEVGNLSYDVQVKLLRALQEKVIQPLGSNRTIPVNVRIIAATNDDLLNSISADSFRQDLYHRINEFKIQLAPLRDRGNELDNFIRHFTDLSNSELGRNVQQVSPEAMEVLHRYDWPGNLRELKNVIKRMVLLTTGETAGTAALPDEMLWSVPAEQVAVIAPDTDLKAQNEVNEKALIQKTLQQVKYNKSKAAQLLNIDRKTLYSKMERYGL